VHHSHPKKFLKNLIAKPLLGRRTKLIDGRFAQGRQIINSSADRLGGRRAKAARRDRHR
jgi:hypothetical protein